jgi:hypothetical protein
LRGDKGGIREQCLGKQGGLHGSETHVATNKKEKNGEKNFN